MILAKGYQSNGTLQTISHKSGTFQVETERPDGTTAKGKVTRTQASRAAMFFQCGAVQNEFYNNLNKVQ